MAVIAMTFQIRRALENSFIYVTALREAATAFKREERMRQSHSGSFRLTKHNRDIGEQVDLTRMTRSDKVLAPQALVHAMFISRFI